MIDFKINSANKQGTFKKIHGMNLGAPITNRGRKNTISEYLKKLHIPQTRMHDCPLNNPGKMLVDMHCIFPLENADPFKEENYIFYDTDDYFANVLDCNTTIMYRLGPSIDHSGYAHHTQVPRDRNKWVEIASHIIEHYNNGWANGFHYNIEYWEIWNEAETELPILWNGTWEEFIDFYCDVAAQLKKRYPHLKIGGPSMAKLNAKDGTAFRNFLAGCQKANAPLDFFTYHQYSDKPAKVIATPKEIRATLDEYGFSDAEIHLTEWHYHAGWGSHCDLQRQKFLTGEMTGTHSAAYVVSVIAGFQHEPIDMTHYYTASTGGNYSMFSTLAEPHCAYYAFDFINQVMELERIEAECDADNVDVLAGKSADGTIKVLASCFKVDQHDLVFNVPEIRKEQENFKLTVIDIDGGLKTITKEIMVEDGKLSFEKASGSMTVFLEVFPA